MACGQVKVFSMGLNDVRDNGQRKEQGRKASGVHCSRHWGFKS